VKIKLIKFSISLILQRTIFKFQEKYMYIFTKYFLNTSLHPEDTRIQLSHSKFLGSNQKPSSNNKTRFLNSQLSRKIKLKMKFP